MRVIFFIFLLIRGTHLSCQLWGKFSSSALAKDGDITFGGIFTLHYKGATPAVSYSAGPLNPGCVGFNLRAFRWAQGMIFAIEEINQDEYLLPNITLGYKIHDSCANPPEALRATLSLVNGEEDISILNSTCKDQSVAAVIGCSGSTQSITIARILGSFGIPQISYFSSCACLSDKHEFPTFFRTIPSDYFQVQAWVKVVKHFGWTWIGAFGSDDAYGHFGIQSFLEEIKKIDACIAFAEYFPAVYTKGKIQEHIELIKKSKAKVILVFATEIDMYILANELLKQNVTGIVWLASESWATAGLLSTKEMFGTLGGLLGLGIQRSSIKGIKDFLLRIHPADYPGNVYIKEFWETTFKCTLASQNYTTLLYPDRKCTGFESLQSVTNIYTDVSQLRITYNTYKAVYAIAHALHNVLFCENNTKVCHSVKEIEPWKVTHSLKEVQFKVKTGDEIQFDHNGDPRPSYDIINWQLDVNGDVQYVDIGFYDGSAEAGYELTINEDNIIWNGGQKKVITSSCSESCPPGTRKATREGEPICCFDCVPCAQDEISNSTDSIDCIRCPWNHWPNSMKNTCLPKAVEYLSFGEMMGIILSALGVAGACLTVFVAAVFFHFRSTPIVRANNSEISFLLLFSLLLCFLCSFLFIGEPSHWSCKLKHAAFGITFVLCISCVLGKTLVVIMAFKSTLPGHNIMKCFGPLQQRLSVFFFTCIQIIICILWITISPPFPSENTKYFKNRIIFECNLGSVAAFCFVLGYIGLLSIMCFILAFIGRKLPDNFNEAKYITFSMLIFCAVWITFIPAYLSSPGKYTVAVEVFAILSSSFGVLLCIFAPKCYIILLRPETNTKKHVMGRSTSSAKI
ncbi:extracellular calcium-sensing receptor-like [Erpetoichthys calabaricus]|uniref:extracellular calcium-sensing receptor-like n=1 Tax=Erpetoichthys calabaricus TaxID=27687 RepID=UPI00223409A8|nr:extracellular calcium-sensing receptor-like [Erpetoichthys calabaricus]